MQGYHIGIFDNDYNSLVKKVTINSDAVHKVTEYCKEHSWTGESYVLLETYTTAFYKADVEL